MPTARRAGRIPAWLTIDWRELATGTFVVTMALLGSTLSPRLFAYASDIVVTQVLFELPMALLAVCAGKAIMQPTIWRRAAYVGLGLVGVAAAGLNTALELEFDAPSAVASGAWLILARAAPPRGCAWFSADHCRAIEVTAGTAWACLTGGLLLLALLSASAPPSASGQTAPRFRGCYYLALAFLLPNVHRRVNTRRLRTTKR